MVLPLLAPRIAAALFSLTALLHTSADASATFRLPLSAKAGIDDDGAGSEPGENPSNLAGRLAGPSSLDVGSVDVFSRIGQSGTLRISNEGTGALQIEEASSSNPAFVVMGSCAAIAPGSSCDLMVTFAPAARGPDSGVVRVQATNGQSLDVSVQGAGTGAVLVVPSGTVGGRLAACQRVMLPFSNSGDGPTEVHLAVQGGGPLALGTGAFTLEPGGSRTVSVVAPSAAAGTYPANVIASWGSGTQQTVVPLSIDVRSTGQFTTTSVDWFGIPLTGIRNDTGMDLVVARTRKVEGSSGLMVGLIFDDYDTFIYYFEVSPEFSALPVYWYADSTFVLHRSDNERRLVNFELEGGQTVAFCDEAGELTSSVE